MNNQMLYYKEGIMESLHDIDHDRYYHNRISSKSLDKVLNLAEAYSIMSKCEQDAEAINESSSLYHKIRSLVKEYDFRKRHKNEAFENPFDEIGDTTINTRYEEMADYDFDEKDFNIGRVRLWNNNTDNKIMFKGGKMIAGQFFGINDTIEECPVRILYEKDMYSENIREFAFTIDAPRGIYAIPFGYASYYRNSLDCNIEPNADYEYVDGETPIIRIFATRNIKRGHEIVLYAEDSDFGNEIKPGQFKYDQDSDPFYRVKNIKIA